MILKYNKSYSYRKDLTGLDIEAFRLSKLTVKSVSSTMAATLPTNKNQLNAV